MKKIIRYYIFAENKLYTSCLIKSWYFQLDRLTLVCLKKQIRKNVHDLYIPNVCVCVCVLSVLFDSTRSQCLPCSSFTARSWSWRRSRETRWGFICASPATGYRLRSANVFTSTFIVSNSDYCPSHWTGYRVLRFLRAGWKCNRIFLFRFTVPPMIHVPNQLVGAPLGTDVDLECFVEASPMSINYWVKDPKGKMTFNYSFHIFSQYLLLTLFWQRINAFFSNIK